MHLFIALAWDSFYKLDTKKNVFNQSQEIPNLYQCDFVHCFLISEKIQIIPRHKLDRGLDGFKSSDK